MATSASVKLSFDTKGAQREITALSNAMKQAENEFKTADITLKSTGSTMDRLTAKSKALSSQLENQRQITKKSEEMAEFYSKAQEKATVRLEKANAAYKKGSVDLKSNLRAGIITHEEYNESIKKLRENVDKEEKSVTRNGQKHDEWTMKVSKSKLAEAQLSDQIKQTSQAMDKQRSFVAQVSEKYGQLSEKYDKVQQGLTKTGKVLTAGVTAPIMAAATVAAKSAVDFERSFAGVKKTVDGTPEQLEAIKQGIIDMSTVGVNGGKAIPLKTAELNELAAAGGQLGIQTDNILKFTETMAMLGTATNLAGESGAQALARFMNVTNTSQDNVDRLGAALVDLGNNSATTEAEIINMALDMGAAGNTVGMSTQAILGYSTALSSMGVEAASGGSSMQRIWLDIQNAVSNGGEELEDFAKISGQSAEQFKKSWGDDADKAFRTFLKGMRKMTEDERVSLLTNLGFNNVKDQAALLALTGEKGFDILAESINRANTAWSENTALQNEFNNIADTTASKLQVAKQNITEAARSLGEVLLPVIGSGAEKVSELAHKFSELSDGQQQFILKSGLIAAAAGPALSTASKGLNVVKGGISVISALGKAFGTTATAATAAGTAGAEAMAGVTTAAAATEAAAATGTSALAGMAAAAGPVTIAIAAIAAAAIGGKVAYDHWYDSTYKWSEGMSESVQKVQEDAQKLKKLADYQKEISDLKIVINSDKSSKEEIETAQNRIKEIAELLADEYNLVVKADASDIDAALEKAKELQRSELLSSSADYKTQLTDKYDEFKSAPQRRREDQDTLNYYNKLGNAYANLKADLVDLNNEYKNGTITKEEYLKSSNDILKSAREESGLGSKLLPEVLSIQDYYDALKAISSAGKSYEEAKSGAEEYKQRLDELDASTKEYTDTAKKYADSQLDLLKSDVALGDNEHVAEDLQNIAWALDKAGISAAQYGIDAAMAMSGFSTMSEAMEKGGDSIDRIKNNYSKAASEMGMNAAEIAAGTSLIQNGFTNVADAATQGSQAFDAVKSQFLQMGAESGATAAQLTEVARAMEIIPENYTIRISADGSGVDTVNELNQTIEHLDTESGISVKINAETGGFDVINEVGQTIAELKDMGAVSIKVDAETGDINVLNEAKEVIAQLQQGEDGTIHINYEVGEVEEPDIETEEHPIDYTVGEVEEPEVKDAEANVNYKTGGFPTEVPDASGNANYNLGQWPTTVPDALGNANFNLGTHPENAPDIPGTANYTMGDHPTKAPTITGTINYVIGSIKKLFGEAHGTDNFPGGLAMINDQKGIADPRELVEHKGKYYMFEGRDVIVPLDKGDKVFTASQTKQMVDVSGIPHFATGSNNEAFNNAKDDFEYRQKTSVVTDQEALLWWKNILEEYASDAEVVKEANIEIYELTQKINKDAINDYKERLSKQESNSKDWIEREVKLHDLSVDGQIAAYKRMDKKYLDTLNEMIANTTLTEKELSDAWDDYYKTIRDHELEIADLRKQKLEELNDISKEWISDRTYYNDWKDFADDPISAYNRVKERNLANLREGIITQEEYDSIMEEFGQQFYEGRVDNSDEWLRKQEKFASQSIEDYIAGLKRVKDYTQQYINEGIIYGQYASNAMDDINEKLFDSYFDTLSNYVDEYYNAQKEMLDAKRKAIEAEYSDEEKAETKSDRNKELSEIEAQYNKYRNAVTIEGKNKLKEIQEEIERLRKEERREAREEEKQSRLDALEDENDALEKEQKNAEKGLNRHVAQMLGIIDGGNSEMTEKFNALIKRYSEQQKQLLTEGYNTVHKLVGITNAELAKIGAGLYDGYGGYGNARQDINVSFTQQFNNNITDSVTAAAYGKYAGAAARKAIAGQFGRISGG